MYESVKHGFAVWPWASHFPSLGFSDLISHRGTIIAVLPTSQGGYEGSKQCWADFLAPVFRGT